MATIMPCIGSQIIPTQCPNSGSQRVSHLLPCVQSMKKAQIVIIRPFFLIPVFNMAEKASHLIHSSDLCHIADHKINAFGSNKKTSRFYTMSLEVMNVRRMHWMSNGNGGPPGPSENSAGPSRAVLSLIGPHPIVDATNFWRRRAVAPTFANELWVAKVVAKLISKSS